MFITSYRHKVMAMQVATSCSGGKKCYSDSDPMKLYDYFLSEDAYKVSVYGDDPYSFKLHVCARMVPNGDGGEMRVWVDWDSEEEVGDDIEVWLKIISLI
jgi:hypothetical protein